MRFEEFHTYKAPNFWVLSSIRIQFRSKTIYSGTGSRRGRWLSQVPQIEAIGVGPVQLNHALHPIWVEELGPDMSGKDRTRLLHRLATASHCRGQTRDQIASTIPHRRRMHGASREKKDSPRSINPSPPSRICVGYKWFINELRIDLSHELKSLPPAFGRTCNLS